MRAALSLIIIIALCATSLSQPYPSSCPWAGIYTLQVPGVSAFPALCDVSLAGDGWLVIARRFDGHENFYRNWTQYEAGFGELTGEFFIGLDRLHAITASQPHELYVYLEDFEGGSRYAHYDDFLIGNATELYNMQALGAYSGDAGDSLRYQEHMNFTTYDKDHSTGKRKCGILRLGAWWYNDCAHSNLFGLYLGGDYAMDFDYKGMFWIDWRGTEYSYKSIQMMVRPKRHCSKL